MSLSAACPKTSIMQQALRSVLLVPRRVVVVGGGGNPCLACSTTHTTTTISSINSHRIIGTQAHTQPFSTATKKGASKKKGGGAAATEGGGDATKNVWYIKLLDQPPAPQTKALPPDVQERYKAIGRRYNIEFNRRAARQQGDLHRKIKLKNEAIEALPKELQAEAKTIDLTPFPPTRRITTHTPPIPGFEAGPYDLPGAV